MQKGPSVDADRVARAAHDAYARLPGRKGKPAAATEWTVLAAFVAVPLGGEDPVVLSLGTGTKCLSTARVAPHVVADQHAEVVARRALVHLLRTGPVPVLEAPGTQLVLYTSREPCGAARVTHSGDEAGGRKRHRVDGASATLRKPGKGPPAASRSCADKITKWAGVSLAGRRGHALAGARASTLLLDAVVVGGPFEGEGHFGALVAARCPRLCVVRTTLAFVHDEAEGRSPSGLSINWALGLAPEVVQPDGRLQGATGNALTGVVNPKHVSRLSPQAMDVGALHALEAQQYAQRRADWERTCHVNWLEDEQP